MLRIEERPEYIEINVSDTPTKADYDRLLPRLERLDAPSHTARLSRSQSQTRYRRRFPSAPPGRTARLNGR